MDRILNFVALRLPPTGAPLLTLADASDFQRQLASAAEGPPALANAVGAAQAFVESGRFVVTGDQVNHGIELLALYDRMVDSSPLKVSKIETVVRKLVGDLPPADWAAEVTQARDSVLAGYLLGTSGPSAANAVKLVRVYAVVDAVLATGASRAQLDQWLQAPLVLPGYLLELREGAATALEAAPASPDEVATGLLEKFQAALERHARLSDTLADIASHDEDELVLSELGEQRPLALLYRAAPAPVDERRANAERGGQKKNFAVAEFAGSSPLRRAAARANVIFSDTAVRLLSEPARQTLRSLALDPSVATVREMQSRVLSEHTQATQTLRGLTIQLGDVVKLVDDPKRRLIEEALRNWKVEPVDDPTAAEPVTLAPPLSFSKIKPLGIADLYLVRTHLSRYERGEVAALENILGGEKLTHTVRQFTEVETTDTTESEQTSLQTLAQIAAEQNSGKTTAQAVGTGRGPLTSDGPESFSKAVTDQVSSSSSNRKRKASMLRQLQRSEEALEHIFDHTAGTDVRFGVYQWLDKIYQAQVFNYGARLLYDIIIPEPAALFREALSRPRSQAALPPRPAKFKVPADQLSLLNWSYYATGHQATGVEAPPQAKLIVSENFGGKAPDPYSSELNANTLEVAESRTTRIPKGYKATAYRLVAEASGWTPYVLRAIIGSKTVAIDDTWSGKVFSGKLEGEVESLPVGLIADGNGINPSISTLAVGIEIVCEPTDELISAWQTKTHGLILAANQRRLADYEERVANRDATARLQLQALSGERKATIIQAELKRTTLAVLTNQNFSTFNANRLDTLGFPYPDAAATTALSAYIRFFEQAVEWEHLECAFFPYFWGSRSSWVSKILEAETNPQFSAFLSSGAARVVLPIRPGYEVAFEHFLNTGKTPTLDELLDVGGPLWVSLVSELRHQGAQDDSEVAVGDPWEFRLASNLVRAREDGRLPQWTLTAGNWVEQPDPNS